MKGRHALAEAAFSPAVRRPQLAVAGAAGLGLTLAGALVAFAAFVPGGSGGSGASKAAVVNVLGGRPAPVPAAGPPRPVHPARTGDQAALAFYADHDPLHARHVAEVVWTGPMLRVYTDLPATDADSKTAIALCETAAAYVETQDRIPMVFVHADRNAGYPVLANKMSTGDRCRLKRVP